MNSHMQRIDTAGAGYEMMAELERLTGKRPSSLTLGRIYDIDGGGMAQSVFTKLDEERKVFLAAEREGKVAFYDTSDPKHADQIQAVLKRVDENFQLNEDRIRSVLRKLDEAIARKNAKSQTSPEASLPPGMAQGAKAAGASKAHVGPNSSSETSPSWPVRQNPAQTPSSVAARMGARRR